MDDEGPEDYFWEDLLVYIEEDKVVPIIGADLVTVNLPEGEVGLYAHVARQLAQRMKVRIDDLGEDVTLNDVVCRFLDNRGRKEEIYPRIRSLLKDEAFPPSQCLLDLASISHLKLFVSTTFDSQLANAINTRRFGGNEKAEVITYSPGDVQDLRGDKKSLERPVVYQLLGKLSASPDYVVCDEDVLEFLHAMQAESRQPHLLFDELKNNHLLILGCNFSDWLSRFFIRLAKGQPLSVRRDQMEILVDSQTAHDDNLSLFFDHFSYNTKIIPGTPAKFVAELARRWRERHPELELPTAASPAAEAGDGGAEAGQMEAGAIFISYASDDLEAVERIKTTLEAGGVDVWFDKKRLAAGDDWDHKIRRNIANCSLCLPVVSRATEARPEGYFRREWAWAVDRSVGIADDVPFLVPVTVDDTAAYTAKVPERFKKNQWEPLPGGQVTAEFAERLKQMQRDYRKRQRSA